MFILVSETNFHTRGFRETQTTHVVMRLGLVKWRKTQTFDRK